MKNGPDRGRFRKRQNHPCLLYILFLFDTFDFLDATSSEKLEERADTFSNDSFSLSGIVEWHRSASKGRGKCRIFEYLNICSVI